MTQEQEPKETIKKVRDWENKSSPIAPYWEGKTFNSILDIPLDFPYSSVEWDSIFETFIGLLQHENYRIRQAAIARLKTALESENSQVSNREDYQPKSITERLKTIFEVITSQSAITPDIFEDFCYEFRSLSKKAPYGGLILQWLNQLAHTVKRKAPTYEAILAARILLYRSLNMPLQVPNHKFEIAIAQIDGFLRGLSSLCHGLNYAPKYQAMVCPQVAKEISVDVQAEILVRSSEYGFYEGTACSDFQSVEEWETALGDAINKWIFNRLFGSNNSLQSERDLFLSRESIIAKFIGLISEAIKPNEPEVLRFQIALGCHYHWGIENESFAFRAGDKLFIITFGWAD
jgi:hypothetical protein